MKLEPASIIKKFESLKSERINYEDLWQDLADYINPRKNNIIVSTVDGEDKFDDILDSTAISSGELLASSLHSMLTNPSGYFFNLTTGDAQLDQTDAVRRYFQEVVRIIHTRLNNSNFQTEVHEYYMDLVNFGMGNLWLEKDDEFDIRFMANNIASVYIGENRLGRVDTVFREFKYEVKDMIHHFGEDAIPEDIMRKFKQGSNDKYEIIHAVYPNVKLKSNRKGPLSNFDYISQYLLKKKKVILSEGGFNELPYIIGRWAKASGEHYGRGPGEKALPDSKMVNLMKETTIRSSQKVIDPPLQLPDDGFILPLITEPGGLNYYRAGSPDRVEPIFNTARIDFGIELVNEVRQAIREAFYVDQLRLREGPQMTAQEVIERTEQSLRFLGPMLARQQSEFLQPLITRVFNILDRKGDVLPDPPEELTDTPVAVRFSSVMAMSQRQSEAQNVQRTMAAITPFASGDPGVLDNFDGDNAVRFLANLFNFPQEMLRDSEEVEKLREQRAQQQQAAEEQQSQLTDAETVNKLQGLGQ